MVITLSCEHFKIHDFPNVLMAGFTSVFLVSELSR